MLLIYGWKYAGKSGVWFFFTSFLLYILSKSKSSFFGFYYSWNRNNCCWDSFSCLLTDDGNFVVRQLWTPFNIWLHKFSSLRCLRKSAYCALLIISYLDIREKRPKMAKKKIFSIRQQILQQLNLDPNRIETRILHFPITIVTVIKGKSILSQNDGNIATLNKISRIISGPFEAIWFCENEPSYLIQSCLTF